MQRAEDGCLSRDEVRAKLSCLSKADILRLKRIAEYQAMKLRNGDCEDLLAEGLNRVISGARRWPRGLGTIPFMTNVFASIVSTTAKHAVFVGRYEVDTEVDQSGNVEAAQDEVIRGNQTDPVEEIFAHQVLEELATQLGDDPDALAVAMALGEGLTAIETQSQFRLSQKQYDAARKRLRRVVNKIMTKENIA
ncbi:hypothetical protein [Marinobacter salarius]|uniref:hypothetical protein n=1 Tax=Marinobacter salarius TaxID=1420917 RepID=UPI0025A47049|nr:hypothetical protein [Marinobacter salarius]MDM8181017.1 hypothetical protein [Marinobacter salarius]